MPRRNRNVTADDFFVKWGPNEEHSWASFEADLVKVICADRVDQEPKSSESYLDLRIGLLRHANVQPRAVGSRRGEGLAGEISDYWVGMKKGGK